MDSSFSFFERDKRNFLSYMPNFHKHGHNELYYLVSGKTKYFIGGRLYFLQPGDLMFIPKGEHHRTDNMDTLGVDRILLNFDDDFVCSHHLQMLNEERYFRLHGDQKRQIAQILRKIEEESGKKLTGYQELQQLYLQAMLVLLSRNRQVIPRHTPSTTYQRIQDAARYIDNNYTQELSLDILAKMYYISPEHFSKQFKNITGTRVSEYINMTRITAAQEILCAGKISIAAVALKCGFSDSNYFTRKFKEITGITPKQYAKQYGSF